MSKVERVLVVDDYPGMADALRVLLSGPARQVRTAHGGVEALAIAREVVPDLVLVDLGLPDLHGAVVALQLRRILPAASRLIAMSGNEDALERHGRAFDAVLVKPVLAEALRILLS
jgi:CheY-like chemotaxis protein